MAGPPSEPSAPAPTPQAQAAVPQDQRFDPTPTLAHQLAAEFIARNYQAMATLISPTLLVTPAHVLVHSKVLFQDLQEATIEFLGIPEQPKRSTVLDVDEGRDFAVLQLDSPVSIYLTPNLVRRKESFANLTWESY